VRELSSNDHVYPQKDIPNYVNSIPNKNNKRRSSRSIAWGGIRKNSPLINTEKYENKRLNRYIKHHANIAFTSTIMGFLFGYVSLIFNGLFFGDQIGMGPFLDLDFQIFKILPLRALREKYKYTDKYKDKS
jgi:Ca2+-dependent lipid-binding protein